MSAPVDVVEALRAAAVHLFLRSQRVRAPAESQRLRNAARCCEREATREVASRNAESGGVL